MVFFERKMKTEIEGETKNKKKRRTTSPKTTRKFSVSFFDQNHFYFHQKYAFSLTIQQKSQKFFQKKEE